MGVSKPEETDIEDLFANLGALTIPDFEDDAPQIKFATLNEIRTSMKVDRRKLALEREQRYKSNMKEPVAFMTDDEFMARGNELVGEPSEYPPVINIMQEDLDSYAKEITAFEEPAVEKDREPSAYDRLYAVREKIKWTQPEKAAFKMADKKLEYQMNRRKISRIANASRRITKAENVNLEMKRYDANEIKERVENGEEDLFGFFSLVPHTLVKTSEPAFERKRKLMLRYHDLVGYQDYSNCPHKLELKKEYSEYIEIQQRMKLLEETISVLEKRKQERDLMRKTRTVEETAPQTTKVSRKRKLAKAKTITYENIEEENRKAKAAKTEEEMRKKKELEIEQRKKAIEAKKRREEEEKKKKKQAEQEEKDRERERIAAAKEEEDRILQQELEKEAQKRLEEDRRADEERKREEEEQLARIREADERKRKETVEKAKALQKKRDAEELERMKRMMAATQKAVDNETIKAVPAKLDARRSSFALQENYHFLKVAIPKAFEETKGKKRSAYNLPGLPEHLGLELAESLQSYNSAARPLDIPRKTNQTKVINMVLPKPKVVKPKVVEKPHNAPAAQSDVDGLMTTLKSLLDKRSPHPTGVDPKNDEVDYQQISLKDLKDSLVYPFELADGMYWPVFYGLPATEKSANEEHAEAYTKCNSFSGKYASSLLLTATPEEDGDTEKKFEEIYFDSDGDWADYSRKPGRFSRRIGYKAQGGSNEDFDVQKERAVEKYHNDFVEETRRRDEYLRNEQQFDQDGDQVRYAQHWNIHLRELVREARLDVYSEKETYDGFGVDDHPGTRKHVIKLNWVQHGYARWIKTRDEYFAKFINNANREYDSLLPEGGEEFDDWCLTPMLASLYYQAYYDTFYVFPKDDQEILEARRKKYLEVFKKRKIDLKEIENLCALTQYDKKQWTILLDQLVSHFRDFPAVFQLIYNKKLNLLKSVEDAVHEVMSTTQKNNSNGWEEFADYCD